MAILLEVVLQEKGQVSDMVMHVSRIVNVR